MSVDHALAQFCFVLAMFFLGVAISLYIKEGRER